MPKMDSQCRTASQMQRVPSEKDKGSVEKRGIRQHQSRAPSHFVGTGNAFSLRGRVTPIGHFYTLIYFFKLTITVLIRLISLDETLHI